MTTPIRRRRRQAADDIPADLAAWFAGEPRPPEKPDIPWSALIVPDYVLLGERWQAWKAAHPDAKPPAGFEDLDDRDSKHYRHPTWQIEQAHKMLATAARLKTRAAT